MSSTYKLVFIIVVIVQSKIVQAVNFVQVDPNKMAAARVAMVIVVDDVLLENPYLCGQNKEPGTHCLRMLQITPEFRRDRKLSCTFVIRATKFYVIAYWYCGSRFRTSVGLLYWKFC